MPRVAIVVATHAICYPMDKCIRDHAALCESPEDLMVVDNGSSGEVSEYVRELGTGCTVIERAINGHFCGGYNTGIQRALDLGYDYVLIVNADTEVINKDYLRRLVDYAEEHSRAAFVGPLVFNGDTETIQNTMLTFPWFWRYLCQWLRAPFDTTNRSAQAKAPTRVEFLNGVCVLCRVAALKEVGLMDETMGGYVEDADWSSRSKRKGWTSVFVPVPGILHHQEAAQYQHFSLKSYMLRRNHVYWHRKEQRYLQATGFFLLPLALSVCRALFATVQRRDSKAYWYFCKRFFIVGFGILFARPQGDWFGPPTGDYRVPTRSE